MKKIIYILSGFFGATLLLLGGYALANPSAFESGNSTSSATSTVTFMTAGTATTTLAYDSSLGGGTNSAAEKAQLFLQITGSSSALTLVKYRFQYSHGFQGDNTIDCTATVNRCDWYSVGEDITTTATTSSIVSQEFIIDFASTSDKIFGIGDDNRMNLVVEMPTIAKFSRVQFFIPPGVGNAAIWATIKPLKQKN